LHFSEKEVRGYYTDLRSKTEASTASHSARLQPAALAQLGLGWLERVRLGEVSLLAQAAQIALALRQQALDVDAGALAWPYSVDVPKYELRAPWFSAMAQGQIASFFVRFHTQAGDAEAAETAVAALRGLEVLGSQLVVASPHGPSLEEVPRGVYPTRILNGWIYALWGVRDVAVGCSDSRAASLFDESTAALAALLPRYDLGWWSRYSLASGTDLAKPYYHRLHVVQLDVMHHLTGLDVFADYSAKWHRTASRMNAARAVARIAHRRLTS
jgi:hypothetical protein